MSSLVSKHAKLLLFLESVLENFQLTISKGDEAYEIVISVHLPFPYSTTFKLNGQFQTWGVQGSEK